jgi:hypothetical protein
VDAVHLAAALHAHRSLEAGTDGAAGAERSADPAALLAGYGRRFLPAEPATALRYMLLAADAAGGEAGQAAAAKGRALREVLVEGRAHEALLAGAGGQPPLLAALLPNADERGRVLRAAARECQLAAQPDEAVAVYLAAGEPRPALAILNQRIADALPAAVEAAAAPGGAAAPAARALEKLLARGREAAAALAGSADAGGRREAEAFAALLSVRELLAAARGGRHEAAVAALRALPFLPMERDRADAAAREAAYLHPALAERLADVLAAAADSMQAQQATRGGAAGGAAAAQALSREGVDALVAFANAVPLRLPPAVYQKLAECKAALMG